MSFRRQHIRNVRAGIEAGTPLDGEYPWDQTLKTIRAGDGVTVGGNPLKKWRYSFSVSPAQITGRPERLQSCRSEVSRHAVSDIGRRAQHHRNYVWRQRRADERRQSRCIRHHVEKSVGGIGCCQSLSIRRRRDPESERLGRSAVFRHRQSMDARWRRDQDQDHSAGSIAVGSDSPAQLTADTNDYAPANITLATTLRLSTDASRNITGLVDAREGAIKSIINVGNNPLVLQNQNAGSAAADGTISALTSHWRRSNPPLFAMTAQISDGS